MDVLQQDLVARQGDLQHLVHQNMALRSKLVSLKALIADRELIASADAADRAARLSARADRASVMSAARSALTALAARTSTPLMPNPQSPNSQGPDPLHSPHSS